MKYFLIAGEASGDLHASNLMKALSKYDSGVSFAFTGGDLMASVSGQKPVVHYRNMAFMGVIDVLKNLRTIRKNFETVKNAVLRFKPDALILVDYPGFNLRMAKWAKKQGIKVFYYISPKLWAWKEGRVEIIRQNVDKMFVILPFEVDFYKKHSINVQYVGNPVVDAVTDFKPAERTDFLEKYTLEDKPLIALLPGSRKQEIKRMLPIMEKVQQNFPGYQFLIAGAPSLDEKIYKQTLEQENIPVIFNETYNILAHSTAAIVTSGTATLETALFGIPQVVGYRTQALQYWIGKHIVDITYFSLVNLIMDEPVVPELLQGTFNSQNINMHLKKLLHGDERMQMLERYKRLKEKLGNKRASGETARAIINLLK